MNEGAATHPSPVWNDRADFLVYVDLTPSGIEGGLEELPGRFISNTSMEVCCIPYFANGISLGDVVEFDPDTGRVVGVPTRAGHRTLRVCLNIPVEDRQANRDEHIRLHAWAASTSLLHEFHGDGWCSTCRRTKTRSSCCST
ncbi:MAG: DUF4265 domain-containing protein [Planctomycetota bacterium]